VSLHPGAPVLLDAPSDRPCWGFERYRGVTSCLEVFGSLAELLAVSDERISEAGRVEIWQASTDERFAEKHRAPLQLGRMIFRSASREAVIRPGRSWGDFRDYGITILEVTV
jgi:hypothetical protein